MTDEEFQAALRDFKEREDGRAFGRKLDGDLAKMFGGEDKPKMNEPVVVKDTWTARDLFPNSPELYRKTQEKPDGPTATLPVAGTELFPRSPLMTGSNRYNRPIYKSYDEPHTTGENDTPHVPAPPVEYAPTPRGLARNIEASNASAELRARAQREARQNRYRG